MVNSKTPNIFSTYQKQIEKALVENLDLLGPKSPLRDACAYALTAGGKRIRPAIVLMTAKSLGFGIDVTFAALAIEYFHTASLVADDLPAMDDDDERRNKPSTHKVFGESTALLTSYALISAGYLGLAKNMEATQHQGFNKLIYPTILENAAYNTGLHGATGGQFLDLSPPNLDLPTLKEIIHKKTSSLFEISFVTGWLFGGGDINALPLVKKAASHFGLAFQIADDLDDKSQDKINGSQVNLANVCGQKAAREMFHVEHSRFIQTTQQLGLTTPEYQELALLLRGSQKPDVRSQKPEA